MKLDKIANSGNDEFYTPEYAIEPLIKYIPKDKVIWCPFDTEDSNIVKAFINNGNKVIATHINTGDDFFFTNIECDMIISNPPYSLKNEVFDKLFTLGKPFAMLVGVVGLFESEKRFSMFANNKFEIMWLSKRIAYFKDFKEQIPSLNPPFSSVWLTSNILLVGNVFETVTKTKAKLKEIKDELPKK